MRPRPAQRDRRVRGRARRIRSVHAWIPPAGGRAVAGSRSVTPDGMFAARVRPGRAVRSAARGCGQSICRRVLVSGLNSRWPPDPGQRLVALSARLPTRVHRESRSSAEATEGSASRPASARDARGTGSDAQSPSRRARSAATAHLSPWRGGQDLRGRAHPVGTAGGRSRVEDSGCPGRALPPALLSRARPRLSPLARTRTDRLGAPRPAVPAARGLHPLGGRRARPRGLSRFDSGLHELHVLRVGSRTQESGA